jgi:hypothetical protein
MASAATNALAISAAALGGLLAGPAVNRVLVEIPAWTEVGALSWAQFTRAGDLGPGLLLYPVTGLGGLLLTLATALSFRFDRMAPRAAAVPVYGSAIMAVVAFFITARLLVPPTLSLRQVGDDPAELQQIFATIAEWWRIKAVLHVLTFGANVWALGALLPARAVATAAGPALAK